MTNIDRTIILTIRTIVVYAFRMPIHTAKKWPALQDWHKADIKAALERAGWTLRKLGAAHGYSPKSLHRVLWAQWPAAERIVADAIGVPVQVIWPSRYPAGAPSNDSQPRRLRNGKVSEAA